MKRPLYQADFETHREGKSKETNTSDLIVVVEGGGNEINVGYIQILSNIDGISDVEVARIEMIGERKFFQEVRRISSKMKIRVKLYPWIDLPVSVRVYQVRDSVYSSTIGFHAPTKSLSG